MNCGYEVDSRGNPIEPGYRIPIDKRNEEINIVLEPKMDGSGQGNRVGMQGLGNLDMYKDICKYSPIFTF